jgi:hypothetical protein
MLFGDAEREYRNLKKQFAAGQLSEADFRARLENMMIEDDQGKWWSIGYETGKWYYHDGEQWVRGDPPAEKSTTTPAAGTGAAVTRSAATDVPGVSSTGASAEPPGSAPGNLAAAGALGAAAAVTPATTSASASVPGSRDASAQALGANAPAAAPGRRKSLLTAVIGALVVVVLAAGAYIVLSRQFMVRSKSEPPPPTADAGSGQARGGAMVMTAPPEGSPTTVAIVALLPTETPAPTDTQSPASVPPTATATPEPTAAPSATLLPPTEIKVPDTPTPEPPTPTPVPPTATPMPTATRRPAATATRVPPTAQPAVASAPAVPGLITGFEQLGRWVIGQQPYGTFTQSTQEAHSGSASARLDYNFPAVKDNYLVFSARPPLSIPGTPTALSMWVLGDGSGHFLNVWVQDSQGEVRQFNFGRVPAAGTWQKLTAALDTTADWPQAHISGTDNGKLDYPIKLYALVLDGVPDGTASQGTIYLDDIMTATANNAATQPEPAPSAAP